MQQLPGGTDKWAALQIFLIARRLAHDHQGRCGITLAPDGLGCGMAQVAAGAAAGLSCGGVQILRQGLVRGLSDSRRDLGGKAGRGAGAGVAHGLHPAGRVRQHLRDQPGFRQVLPVFHRHFRPHGIGLDPRRVEDVGEIGLPQFMAGIGGQVGTRRGRFKSQAAVKADCAFGRGDQPVHVGEAFRKERRRGFQNGMLGFEPSAKAAARAVARHFVETDKGVHLVDVAAHGFRHATQPVCQGVGRIGDETPVILQPDQRGIQQGPAFRVGMAGHGPGQVQKIPGRHHRVQAGGRDGIGAEQSGIAPDNLVRRHATAGKLAGRVAPGLETSEMGQIDADHSSCSCSALGANRARRLSLSVSAPGCQSGSVTKARAFDMIAPMRSRSP